MHTKIEPLLIMHRTEVFPAVLPLICLLCLRLLFFISCSTFCPLIIDLLFPILPHDLSIKNPLQNKLCLHFLWQFLLKKAAFYQSISIEVSSKVYFFIFLNKSEDFFKLFPSSCIEVWLSVDGAAPAVVIKSRNLFSSDEKSQLVVHILLDVMDLDSVLLWILFICMNWFSISDIWKNVMVGKNMHVSFLYFPCQIT